MIGFYWILAIFWYSGMCTPQNATDHLGNVMDGEEINISINKQQTPSRILHGKVQTEDTTDKINHISKQINVNLNLEYPKELTGQKSSNQKNVQENYTDSPNPFYEFVRGFGYYKLHTEQKTWNEAKAICEREGAHLAIINSNEEVKLYVEMRNRLPKIYNDWRDETMHIGVNDIDNEGIWVTIFGQPLENTGFSEWGKDFPIKGRERNCACFKPYLEVLHNAACNWKFGFYCEKEI